MEEPMAPMQPMEPMDPMEPPELPMGFDAMESMAWDSGTYDGGRASGSTGAGDLPVEATNQP